LEIPRIGGDLCWVVEVEELPCCARADVGDIAGVDVDKLAGGVDCEAGGISLDTGLACWLGFEGGGKREKSVK
jgi:hypothetical protein